MHQTDEITIQEAEEDLINHFLYSNPSKIKSKQNLFKSIFNFVNQVLKNAWYAFNYFCWFIIFILCLLALLG